MARITSASTDIAAPGLGRSTVGGLSAPEPIQRDTCRLCTGRDVRGVVDIVATPIGDAFVPAARLHESQRTYPLELRLCRGCGNVQLGHVVDAEAIYREYGYVTSISLGLSEYFQQAAADILRRTKPPAGSLVVEIGSNEGAMLRAFQAGGMRVLGVDPAQAIAECATAAGVETLSTYFTAELGRTIRRVRGPAAIVAANNVIANVDNLADLLEGVRSLLAPHGTFVFETSYWADVVEHALLDTVFHEHLSYFSVGPLQHYFHRHGMELVAVERIPTKGGSIRGTVRLADGAPAVEASVAKLIAHEGRLGLRRLDTYESLRARLTAAASELHGLVGALKAEGHAVAGYGASVGITTLIYSFGLGRLLDFLVDDNPQKQGLFSPGWHLPVCGSAVLDEQRKADYVVLLAWRYVEPILRRHARFLAQGGRFIRVMPNVEIMSVGGVA